LAGLAALRGHSSDDREALVLNLESALSGDAAALAVARTGLDQARAGAIGGLAFELAGQITEELAALDWASQPQRVTRVGPDRAVAIGWCHGVVLRLEINRGRLHRWDQKLGPQPAAAGQADAGLADFAATNAKLAAALLGRAETAEPVSAPGPWHG
jgi:hypothetical protein